MSSFGEMLKNELKKKKMTQRDLANLMDTSEACISRWINGGRYPNGASIQKIMNLLNCHLEIVSNDNHDDVKDDAEIVRMCRDGEILKFGGRGVVVMNRKWWLKKIIGEDYVKTVPTLEDLINEDGDLP